MNRAVSALVGMVVKRGPDAVKWAAIVTPFVTDTPQRERITALTARLASARRARTPEGRLAREIQALTEAATSAVADAANEQDAERAQRWLRRATTFEHSRRLVTSAQGATRRRGLAQLSAKVDELRDEVLLATLGADEP